jgi:hypothetical protein
MLPCKLWVPHTNLKANSSYHLQRRGSSVLSVVELLRARTSETHIWGPGGEGSKWKSGVQLEGKGIDRMTLHSAPFFVKHYQKSLMATSLQALISTICKTLQQLNRRKTIWLKSKPTIWIENCQKNINGCHHAHKNTGQYHYHEGNANPKTNEISSHHVRMDIMKRTKIIDGGEDMVKRDPWLTSITSMEVSQSAQHRTSIGSSSAALGMHPKQ